MGRNNRSAKEELEKVFGSGCFFKRAHCAEKIERIGTIRTFKSFLTEKKFKGQKISRIITYHHLKHQADGGETTIENGANMEEVAHQYIHSLPREEEEIINNMIREYKINFLITTRKWENTR